MQHHLRRHLYLPRRPRTERTGRLLLVALAADRQGGHPDNVAATSRLLGAAERTVRRWRDGLLAEGLLQRNAAGFLVAGPAWPAWCAAAEDDFAARGLRWGWDPLPRRLLARHAPAVCWAAAVVHGDAVGPRGEAPSAFVRSDRERAALANVARSTIIEARQLLAAAGLDTFEAVTRRTAGGPSPTMVLVRARWRQGSDAGRGAPIGRARAGRLAAAATTARKVAADQVPGAGRQAAGTRRTPDIRRQGGQDIGRHVSMTPPRGAVPIKGAAALPDDGRSREAAADGRRQAAAERRAETERWLEDPDQLRRWIDRGRRTPQAACLQLLELAGFGDQAPGLRRRWAGLIARRHDREAPVLLAALVADVTGAGGRSRARSVGAVLAQRLPRLVAGKGADALSERNRGRPVGDLLRIRIGSDAPPPAAARGVQRSPVPVAAVPFLEYLRQRGLPVAAAQ